MLGWQKEDSWDQVRSVLAVIHDDDHPTPFRACHVASAEQGTGLSKWCCDMVERLFGSWSVQSIMA